MTFQVEVSRVVMLHGVKIQKTGHDLF